MKSYSPLLTLLAFSASVHAQLKVDFGTAASPIATGFQAYAATNAAPDPALATFLAAITGFSSDVTVDLDAVLNGAVVTSNTPANLFRVIDRSSAAQLTNATATGNAELFRDWLAVTQIGGQLETLLRITVGGLPDGDYSWTSWHHDTADQTGLMDVSFTANSTTVLLPSAIDTSNATAVTLNANNGPFAGSSAATNTPTAFTQSFTVTGGSPVIFEISPTVAPGTALSPSQFQSVNFAVMNGFRIDPVPEPSATLLGLSGLLGLLRRRRA